VFLAGAPAGDNWGSLHPIPIPYSWIEEAYLREREPLLMGWKRKGKEDFHSI